MATEKPESPHFKTNYFMTMTTPTDTLGTILLVDDLPENLQLLSELLTQLGYTVRSVASSKMMLKLLKSNSLI